MMNEFNEDKVEEMESPDEVKGDSPIESPSPVTTKQKQTQNSSGWFRTYFLPVGGGFVGATLGVLLLFQTDMISPYNFAEALEGENNVATEEGEEVEVTKVVDSTGDGIVIEDVIENASKSIVGIVNIQQESWLMPSGNTVLSEEGVEAGTGTGVIIDTDEEYTYIVTNNHVVEEATEIEVSLDNGETRIGEVIGSDALTDLSVVRVESEENDVALTYGDSTNVRVGEEVLAIGNPLGLELSKTVTQGIISAIDRSLEVETSAGAWDLSVLQTDAAINPGNSGGALINRDGELIGINSLKIANRGIEGLGFAIPSDEVMPIVEELIDNGTVARPYLGIVLTDVIELPSFYKQERGLEEDEGIMITGVEEGSAAYIAGLEVEDIILSIDGETIADSTDLRKTLYSGFSIGDEINITILRDQVEQTVQLTLTSNQLENEPEPEA
ncbi:S1C family serine protease [Salipaludibacillus sp. HK11]|uniref:S1C family serine protease n=1 Tax=Salipaludibacillus sp. HK11 TaxID=3394320 RepID=UPI0039FCA428